jgi:hypothetical protein
MKKTNVSKAVPSEYQFAITTYALSPNGYECIVIARAETSDGALEQFETMTLKMQQAGYAPLIESRFGKSAPAQTTQPTGNAPICAIHNAPMNWMPSKHGGGFWSCHVRLPDGSWCPYKPPAGGKSG